MQVKKVQGMAAAVLAACMLLASPVWAAEKPASVVQATGGGSGVRTAAPQGITEAQKQVLTQEQKLALEKVYQAVPELKELSVRLDQAKFPDPSRAVTREEAEKAYAGMLEMKLFYLEHQPFYGLFKPEKGETGPALVYAPLSMPTIDALTGKPLAEFMPPFSQTRRITLQGEGRQLIARTPEEAARLLADAFGIDMTGRAGRAGDAGVPGDRRKGSLLGGQEQAERSGTPPTGNLVYL
jgi:hypothetical protein